jgi:short-subunit dehydrogenase
MEKKVVIITGASKGIGLVTAKVFIEKGYIVYGISRIPCEIQEVHSILCDITNSIMLKDAITKIFEKEQRIDILINNAGFGISGSIEKTELKDVHKLFELNFYAVFETIKYVIPYMRKIGGGKIINIGSAAGSLHIPFQAFYSASKAAVEALSNCLRGELSPFNITVVTILPGDTATNFTDVREKKYEESDPDYGKRIFNSIAMMEKDERNGMSPEIVANVIYKAARKKNPRPLWTVGFQYKVFLFLGKLLPKRIVLFIINQLYAK